MRQPYLNEKQHALAAIVAQPVEHFTRNEGVACSNHVNGFFYAGKQREKTASGFFFAQNQFWIKELLTEGSPMQT